MVESYVRQRRAENARSRIIVAVHRWIGTTIYRISYCIAGTLQVVGSTIGKEY